MGKTILGVIFGLIVGVVLLGFTIWLGIAILAMTVGQPSEIELKLLLVVALLVALGSGIFIGRRITLRR
jgi:glycerol-3-phosphate acyltransferase PlsY